MTARTCRACGSHDLQPAGMPQSPRAVCAHCGRCWEDGGDGVEVDTLACPGCPRRGTCESCPTWLVESMTRRHVLRDGGEVVIRPLLFGDRFELAARFFELSPRSRRLRFFNAPDELDAADLEYLTNLDYRNHFACGALLVDGAVPRGVGVARYLREVADPTVAEVAVTVIDDQQRRGIGTLLTRTLGEVAVDNGIRTFVSYVQWDNAAAVELLTEDGARVTPAEPGIARVELDLPAEVDERADPYLHRILARFASFAARIWALGDLRQTSTRTARRRAGRQPSDEAALVGQRDVDDQSSGNG
jgi:GNAT superfamily N-acetyltransferase